MDLVYCESATSGALAPWHVRRVGPEGFKPTGGATPPLCGRRWLNGWDITGRKVTAEDLRMLLRSGDVCGQCAERASEVFVQ
jgi:hypothetical protein